MRSILERIIRFRGTRKRMGHLQADVRGFALSGECEIVYLTRRILQNIFP